MYVGEVHHNVLLAWNEDDVVRFPTFKTASSMSGCSTGGSATSQVHQVLRNRESKPDHLSGSVDFLDKEFYLPDHNKTKSHENLWNMLDLNVNPQWHIKNPCYTSMLGQLCVLKMIMSKYSTSGSAAAAGMGRMVGSSWRRKVGSSIGFAGFMVLLYI